MKPKIIAFYLPQYYPTPENDKWWGKGFTEWTNVGRAKPLFRGHYQPKVPTDLGYYDLRVPETREEQANLAKEYGIDGFCYWHYWFAGHRLLDRVFREVVNSGKPDFPFCLCWANHSWYHKTWDSQGKDKLLIKQTYHGKQDYINHFMNLLPAFKDKRYIRINGKLLFCVYAPLDIPDFNVFKGTWNQLAQKYNLGGFHFKGYTMKPNEHNKIIAKGYNSSLLDYVYSGWKTNSLTICYSKILSHFFHISRLRDYRLYIKNIQQDYQPNSENSLCIIPNFDHSPRSHRRGVIYYNSSPKLWGNLLYYLKNELHYNNETLFIKAWNEWGEGNYLEPDLKYGRGFLEEIRKYRIND